MMELLKSVLGEWLSVVSLHQPLPGEAVPLFDLFEPTDEFNTAVQESEYYELLRPPAWYPARNLLWLFSYFDAAIDTLQDEATHAACLESASNTADVTELPPSESIALDAYPLLIPLHFKNLIKHNRNLIIAHLLQYPWQVSNRSRSGVFR